MSQLERPHARRRGMTLMELLVAVTIMIVMMAMFARILQQSRNVVSSAEQTMQANSIAAAVMEALRGDLRQATPTGFLCIGQRQPNTPPYLAFTRAGITTSVVDNYTASGALVSIGLARNHSIGFDALGNPVDNVLFCQRFLLRKLAVPAVPGVDFTDGGDFIDPADNNYNYDLSDITILPWVGTTGNPPDGLDELATKLVDSWRPSDNSADLRAIHIPSTDFAQLQSLWQVLATKCKRLEIQWTDGEIDGTTRLLNWYGVSWNPELGTDGEYAVKPKATAVHPNAAAALAADDFEYVVNSPGFGAGNYRAMWTHEDREYWPKAVRIRFLLDGTDVNDPNDDQQFEVICPVGQ